MLAPRKHPEEAFREWRARLVEDVRMKRLSLPALPENTRRLRELVTESDAQGVRLLAQALGREPELAARVSQWANAAVHGLPPVPDVEAAVARVGVLQLRSLVFNFCLSKLFREKQTGPLQSELKKLRQQALRTGAVAQWLGARILPEESNALIAGLTHNIGALPVYALFTQHRELAGQHVLMHRLIADRQAQMGQMVLQQWGMPEALQQVPLQVLAPALCPPSNLGDLVTVARKVAEWLERPDSTLPQVFDLPASARLKLGAAQLEQWLARSRNELEEWQRVLAD